MGRMSTRVAGAASADTLADQRRMTAAENYFAWQARWARPYLGRRVLEAGCGIGNFSAAIGGGGALLAVDHDRRCLAEWRWRHGGRAQWEAAAADLSDDFFEELRAWGADTCVCLNVLEHVADDRRALARLAAVIVPGGRIILLVPAFPALFGPIDRALGHHRRYTRAGLAAMAREAALRIRLARYMNLAGFFGWWINARLLRRRAQSPAQIAVFNRLAPVLAKLETAAPPPFGLSLFAVLEKDAA